MVKSKVLSVRIKGNRDAALMYLGAFLHKNNASLGKPKEGFNDYYKTDWCKGLPYVQLHSWRVYYER